MITIETDIGSLDLDNKLKLPYTVKALDLANPAKSYMNHSKQFNIPATDNNNKILQYFDNEELVNGYNAFTTIDCSMYDDGELIDSGRLRILKMNVKSGRTVSYDLQFYSVMTALKEDLIDVNVNTLDYSGWNHASNASVVGGYLSGTRITNTIDGTAPQMFYPLISTKKYLQFNKATHLTYSEGIGFLGDTSSSADIHAVMYDEFRPALNLDWIVDDIFLQAGLTVDNKLKLDTTFTKLALWFNNSAEFEATGTTSRASTTTNLIVRNAQEIDLPLNNVLQDDLLGFTGGAFTVNFNSTYTFKTDITVPVDGGYDIRLYKNGVFNQFQTATNLFTGTLTFSNLVLVAGDVISFKIQENSTQGLGIWDISNIVTIGSTAAAAAGFKPTKFAPNIPAMDLIKGILGMFNAFLIYDVAEDTYTIQNRTDYFALGNEVDITEYVDHKSVIHEPNDKYRSVTLSHSKSEYKTNIEFNDKTGFEYGQVRQLTGSVFGSDFKIDTPFNMGFWKPIKSSVLNSPPSLSDYQSCAGVDKSFAEVADKPLLFIDNGTTIAGANYFIHPFNGLAAITVAAQIDCSNAITSNGHSIAFSSINAADESGYYNTNLYSEYWSTFFNEIYAGENRHKKFTAYVPKHILKTIKPNTTLIIDGNSHFLKELTTDLNSEQTVFRVLSKAGI